MGIDIKVNDVFLHLGSGDMCLYYMCKMHSITHTSPGYPMNDVFPRLTAYEGWLFRRYEETGASCEDSLRPFGRRGSE